jgi:hypothetical protein
MKKISNGNIRFLNKLQKTATVAINLLGETYDKKPYNELVCFTGTRVFRRKGECRRRWTTWPSRNDQNLGKNGKDENCCENRLSFRHQNGSREVECRQINGETRTNLNMKEVYPELVTKNMGQEPTVYMWKINTNPLNTVRSNQILPRASVSKTSL